MYADLTVLLQEIADGNRNAFKHFFYRYYQALFNYAVSIVKSNVVSEEIVSDVFFAIWKNRELLGDINNIEAYLFTAVKNKSLSCLRQAAALPSSNLSEEKITAALIEEQTPEKCVLQNELCDALQRAIEELPAKCRAIFKMARIEGMPYKKIADLLDISVRTIDAQMAIAQKKLHQKLRPYLDK